MTLPNPICPRHAELNTLLAAGQWPAAASPDLRRHAAACSACSTLVLLTPAFQAERAAAFQAAQLPSPELIWWRAQLRRRNAAITRISRPLLGAQIVALAAVFLAAALFAFFFGPETFHWLLTPQPAHDNAAASSLAAPFPLPLSLLLPALALLLLAGVMTLYLARERN